jgi:hypothetical protein
MTQKQDVSEVVNGKDSDKSPLQKKIESGEIVIREPRPLRPVTQDSSPSAILMRITREGPVGDSMCCPPFSSR